MANRLFAALSLIMLVSVPLHSQITLETEELAGTRYRLTFRNAGYAYSVIDNSGSRSIHFTQPISPGEEGTPLLPRRDLFIALPKNTHAPITFTAIKEGGVPDVVPELSPSIRRENDTVLVYVALPPNRLVNTNKNFYRFNGYLWVGGNYCAHITIFPYVYDEATRRLAELKEFRIEMDAVASSAQAVEPGRKSVLDGSIINPRYGSQWKSKGPDRELLSSDSWIDYTQDYLKLGVAVDGIYRLSYSDLVAYGIPAASIDPKTLKIFLRGKQIPIYVSGENDNAFGPGDYIEFLGRRNYGDVRYREIAAPGTPYREYLNRYSDTTIYWLGWNGGAGRRIDTVLAAAGTPSDTTKYYDELLHSETDAYWDFLMSGGEVRRNLPDLLENETWNDGTLGVGKMGIPFSVSNLYPGKPAHAYVKIGDYGASVDIQTHNLALSINSNPTLYDSGYTNKYEVKVLKANFTSSALSNGVNTVNLHSFPTLNTVNTIIRDWFELEYPRFLTATKDSLTFAYRTQIPPRLSVLSIDNVTSPSISLYKFSDADSSVTKITNVVRGQNTLRFIDTVAAGHRYFLRNGNSIPRPIIFYKKKFVNLRNPSNQADYVAITHSYFSAAATAYCSFIGSSYHVSTKLVDVNDIYDEFNYGFYAAEPIRDFLQSTAVYWRAPKPKYVFLIGKTTYDFYGNKTKLFGAPKLQNFVPSYGNPVSDPWFTIWDTTGALIPQMSIGRLPAKNLDEFQSYFSKHQKYLSKGYDDWNKRFLFFAGGSFTDPTQIAQSKAVNDNIIEAYVSKPPIGGKSSAFYKTAVPVTNFGPYSPEYIKDAIDQGGVFISYIGHSGTQTWDNSITDVSQLSNIRDRNPLITDFGCSTGKFAEPDVFSFSELSVNDLKGQAIAYVGNSSLGFTSTAFTFPQFFYKKLLVDTAVSIGESHLLAKLDYMQQTGTSGGYGLFILTNTLIGDPIVTLPLPKKPNFSLNNAGVTTTPERPTEQTDSVTLHVAYNNFGRVVGDSVEVLVKDDFAGATSVQQNFKRKVPLFSDSLAITIPVKAKPGEHVLSVTIDPSNKVDEIYENDNVLSYKYIVASASIRSLTLTPLTNQTRGVLRLLNPSVKSAQSYFDIEASADNDFSASTSYRIPYDTFYTNFKIDTAFYGKRVWLRTRTDASNAVGLTYSYVVGASDNFLLNDRVSFLTMNLDNIVAGTDQLMIDTAKVTLSAISAGFNDGNTAVISKNNQNFVSENTVRGHHVCLFDAVTFENKGYYRFDITGGGTSVVDRYNAFLDTLDSRYILVVAISNEGSTNLTQQLKTNIKKFGSRYIDSVGYSGSWAIIGRKGAASGTVPEKFSRAFAGRIQIDTTIAIPNSSGTFETGPIGPVARWKDAEIRFVQSTGGSVTLSVVGIKANNAADTLARVALSDSIVDLSKVNALQYPTIKLAGRLGRASGQLSPSVRSIAVNYDQLAELGTNYQAVRAYVTDNGTQEKEIASGDTLQQGEKLTVKYRIYNAGGVAATKIGVRLSAVWENNTNEPIASAVIDSLPPQTYKELTAVYNTALGFGRRSLRIAIDPDTLVRELFKDNNLYAQPFYVKKDSSKPLLPNLSISQKDIFPLVSPVTDETDSARFAVVYLNSGALVNDSVTISIRQFYKDANVAAWTLRRKYPAETDTLYLTVPILRRAGEHQLQVELDPVGLITESSESDNSASYFFTVVTTDFKIIQPAAFNTGSVSKMIFLNPTTAAGTRIADLELDSLASFAAAKKVQLPMQEFTTVFDIASLPKPARYYWRIRQQQSDRGWTTGSFYLGPSSVPGIGQADSAGWVGGQLVHAAYAVSGVRIADTRTRVTARSAGFSDGRTGSIEINGASVISSIFGTGHNLVVIDTSTFSVSARKRFDVSNNADESDSLTQFIADAAAGSIVVDVVVDEGSNNLKQSARDALKSIGSASIDRLSRRDSWAIVGRKGAPVGSVPESYVPQFGGAAAVETTFVKKEFRGTIATPVFGPLAKLSAFSMQGVIPAGTSVKTQFFGTRYDNRIDTVALTSGTALSNTAIGNTTAYREGRILFDLQTQGASTPSITSWTLTAASSVELAVSERTASVTPAQVMEGEPVVFTGKVFNVSAAAAESVTVQLSTTESGIEKILKTQKYPTIAGGDSAVFTYTYASRGKKGSRAFTLKIDPADSLLEQTKDNNTVSVPFVVQADSLRPEIQVAVDGERVLDGDYIRQNPEIIVRYTDNNPTAITAADTGSFKIRLNNYPVYFMPGTAELIPSTSPGQAQLKWTPALPKGENFIQIYANDVSGNSSDTTTLFVNVSTDFILQDVYNLPNPFAGSTHFTFNILSPVTPDEVSIKVFTVAGRLIHDLSFPCKIGFNKFFWDGRDRDGDEIANGVYFYKVIVKQGDQQTSAISKLVKMK